MKTSAPPSNLEKPSLSLASRLLRTILGIYFAIAISLTIVQMLLEFNNEKSRLDQEIAHLLESSTPAVVLSIWNFDIEQVNANLSGLLVNDGVLGASIRNEDNKLIGAMGAIQTDDGIMSCKEAYGYRFDLTKCKPVIAGVYVFEKEIIYEGARGSKSLGKLILYSSPDVVMQRAAHVFKVVLISSVIKTLSLWLIAWIILKKWVERPLSQITQAFVRLNPDSPIEDETDETELRERNAHWQDELGIMIRTFLFMREALLRKNAVLKSYQHQLEEMVIKRTFELESRSKLLVATQKNLIAQEKRAAMGSLSAGIAHEINNPNNMVTASAANIEAILADFNSLLENLLSNEGDNEIRDVFAFYFNRMKQQLAINQAGSSRINDIVKKISGAIGFDGSKKRREDVTKLIEETWLQVKSMVPGKIEFICQWRSSPYLECWPEEMQCVFKAVILNACQAIESQCIALSTEVTGSLTVASETLENECLLSFTDTGCGIPEDIQHRIFDPFFTTRKIGHGSGLGLSLCMAIVQQHGGRMDIVSEENKGAQVLIFLPYDTNSECKSNRSE